MRLKTSREIKLMYEIRCQIKLLNADYVNIIGSQVVLQYFFENLIISRQFRNDYGRIFLTLDMRTPILN